MATSSFAIRKTTAKDAESLPAVERSAGQAFHAIPELSWIAHDAVQTVQRHRELIDGGLSWVAVPEPAGDAAPGPVATTPVGFLNGEMIDGFLHIWEMSVDSQCQGKGIGRRLIQTAVEHAKQHHYRGLTLTTFLAVPWNERFYRSAGFKLIAQKDMPSSLTKILNDEARDGLPRERRCAMRLELSP